MKATEYYCLKCSKAHPLHYTLDRNQHRHLIVECPKNHYAIRLHRVESDFRRIHSMSATEAAALIPAVGEYIRNLENRMSRSDAERTTHYWRGIRDATIIIKATL